MNAANAYGETTPGTEFSFTQTAGSQPSIAINDGGLPAWASGRNLYLTAAGGATNSEVLAFTNIAGSTFTIVSPPPASSVPPPSANTTTTNIPKITAFPSLQTGNIARNVYLTSARGISRTEVLYYRESTAATFAFASPAPAANAAATLPTVNTTGYSALDFQLIRDAKNGKLDDSFRRLRQLISDWNRGTPVAQTQTIANMKRLHNVFAVLNQLCAEMGVLVEANPGHLTSIKTGIGNAGSMRVWP